MPRRLDKQLSDSISSFTSSTSSSIPLAPAQPKPKGYTDVNAKNADIIANAIGKSSFDGDIRNGSLTKHAKTRSPNLKSICPKCEGDVCFPSPRDLSTEVMNNDGMWDAKTIDKDRSSSSYAKELLHLTTVMCAFKSCQSPEYHLVCSSIPKGSRLFRRAIISYHAPTKEKTLASEGSNPNHCDAEHVLKHLYSSSRRKWWGNSPEVTGGECPSRESLQNDRNWPTSSESYMCPNCDVEGTSRYLLEYFERFRSMKTSFYTDYLRGSNAVGIGSRLDRADESVETRTGGAFLWHLIKGNRAGYLDKVKADGEKSFVSVNDKAAGLNPSEIQLKNMARVLTYLSKHLQHQQRPRHRCHKRQQGKSHLDPSYLIGAPVQLFNPIDNSYHTGRVLDYKLNAPFQFDKSCSMSKPSTKNGTYSVPNVCHLTDDEICNTLYLIRFRHGVEGRKVAVHQWIYLEEHALNIGGEVCWANVGNKVADVNFVSKNGSSDFKTAGGGTHVLKSDVKFRAQNEDYVSEYRPVQVIFRSMLEMIPVHNLNPRNQNSSLQVLAMGFGRAFSHIRLSLDYSGIRDRKTEQQQSNVAEPAAESMRPGAILIGSKNPPWIDRILHRAQLSDTDVALGLAMACVEIEEERRVRTWRRLSPSHPSRPSPTKRNHNVTMVPNPEVAKGDNKNRCKRISSNNSSLEEVGSFGCQQCMIELKTGMKVNGLHGKNCARKRSRHGVPLEVAASIGCAKCVKEFNTGEKSNKSHDQNCPRKRISMWKQRTVMKLD